MKVLTYCVGNEISRFSIFQPLDYATNHKDGPLSHNVALITSYRRGFSKIYVTSQFSFEKELTLVDLIRPVL